MNETPASALDQAAIFKSLQRLIGNWQGTNEDGQWVGVHYEMAANGSALVENWTFHNQITAPTTATRVGPSASASAAASLAQPQESDQPEPP